MSNTATTTLASTLPQIHAYTGAQIKLALEKHYTALRSKISVIKLHTTRLSNPVLIKNTALNGLTFGKYRELYEYQKTLRNDPVEQNKYRQLMRDIETKYTQAPHITVLCRELKAHKGICDIIIESHNSTITQLEKKAAATLAEKRKVTGRELDTFKTISDKIVDLPNDALFQSYFVAKPIVSRSI
jgi:hypothetical protein